MMAPARAEAGGWCERHGQSLGFCPCGPDDLGAEATDEARRWKAEQRAAAWIRNVRGYLDSWRNRVRSIEITRNGKRYRAVTHAGGPLELYLIGPDGLETFVGYALELMGDARERAQNWGVTLVNNC